MRKIIQKMLSAYEKADAMTAMKARFIFYLCLAIGAVLTAAVVYTSILHLNNPAYGYRIRVPMLGGLAVLSLIIALLRRGRFRTASHLLMTGAFVVIWSIIINDRGDPLARLDTIIFIAAMIALTPIIVVGKGYSIAVYTLLNIAAMYLFMLAYHPGLELSKHSIWEYLADNTSAMLFVAVISYAIFTINRRTFDQTVRLNAELFRKNEELEATNEELQATIEELEATNEDFEAQNEELIAAENDLRQSEEKYRGLVENINEVIYSIDETGNILYMSPGIEKMTGFTLEEMAGENYTHFIHPDDLTYLVNDFDELSHGVVKPSEYRVKTKTGDYIWIMTASRPIFKNGIFAGATGVMTNIHQRRLAEETLRESEEKYRGLVENINEIVYSTDSKGAVSYVSPAITKTLGMAPEEIIGSQFLEFIYPEDREYLLSRFQRVVDGIFEPTEYRLALPSGDFRWVRSNSRPLYADGVFQGVSGIITDIHESKMAERKILQEKAFADAIIDTLPGIFFIIDGEGRLIRWKGRAPGDEAFGYTPEEVKNMDALDMVCEPERESVSERMLRVFSEGQVDTEVTFVRKNGERVIFHVAASRMTLDEKDYIIGIGFEITDRKRAEKERERIQAQLVQAQKLEAVGTLAGGIAHDFNNMLGGIMGSLNLVELLLGKDEPPRRETLLKYVDTAMESSRRAAEITRQLLALSRPMELQSAPVDIGISLKNVLKIGKNTFPKSVILDFQIPEKPVMVYGDPTQIEQMLLNLCVNASHAMTIMRGKGESPGGTLRLRVDETAWDGSPPAPHPDVFPGTAYGRVSISDTGVGMDGETRKRVFEPFFTTKQRGEGTGLGLSMVYSIVKLHRGYIDVRSKPGAGSTFTVHLPLMEKLPMEKQRSAAAGGLLHGTGTVLVVDDEKALLRIAKGMLEQCGYRVITAEGGQAGTEVYAREHGEIDAVFLDLSMPGVSGLEVYERMREIDPKVRVLLTSGLIEDDTLKKALERGIRGFLQKPYSAEELSSKMKEILSD